jgi:threonine dehydrogenase-like Zn-dependent dehydrogenase
VTSGVQEHSEQQSLVDLLTERAVPDPPVRHHVALPGRARKTHTVGHSRPVHREQVAIDGQELFFSHVGLRGDPAPVRRYLPDLVDRVLTGAIDPGQVFDLTLPLDQVAEGYRAMDERRAVKTLLRP